MPFRIYATSPIVVPIVRLVVPVAGLVVPVVRLITHLGTRLDFTRVRAGVIHRRDSRRETIVQPTIGRRLQQ
ncbi:hypothetical protein [Natronococcus pandeyae]|uniref:hypothetical protein n=1 Tax=Natronococcus pandeyae TaxID=2055836 RepID=UPI0011E8334E|nr:hypothetical protein [Natronococcus pandeyae]